MHKFFFSFTRKLIVSFSLVFLITTTTKSTTTGIINNHNSVSAFDIRTKKKNPQVMTRSNFFKSALIASVAMGIIHPHQHQQAFAFSTNGPPGNNNNNNNNVNNNNNNNNNGDSSNIKKNRNPQDQSLDLDMDMMPLMIEPTIAYRSLSLEVMTTETTGVTVPVAVWYPTKSNNKQDISSSPLSPSSSFEDGSTTATSPYSSFTKIMDYPKISSAFFNSEVQPSSSETFSSLSSSSSSSSSSISYNHRISVKRIGQLLAGWEFIPDFASQNYELPPTISKEFVVKGEQISFPDRAPVVLLAHGYLGSRFDLSHLAEKLAQQGFICVSPEYPESLAASYPSNPKESTGGTVLDRTTITTQLVNTLKSNSWGFEPTSFGIVGHSLGCGTALSTGDDTWTRVCIAGGIRKLSTIPSTNNPVLFITSMNDSTTTMFTRNMGGGGGSIQSLIPSEYVQLEESTIMNLASSSSSFSKTKLPTKASLIFDRPDGPNHISYLSEGVNNAMIDLLSPLLPIAQLLSIPVLDFDKYQTSRDSKQTATIVIPLIVEYLKQNMI